MLDGYLIKKALGKHPGPIFNPYPMKTCDEVSVFCAYLQRNILYYRKNLNKGVIF